MKLLSKTYQKKINQTSGSLFSNAVLKTSLSKQIKQVIPYICYMWFAQNVKHFQNSFVNVLVCFAYFQITQLKIDHNPFAKGFRDNGMGRRYVMYASYFHFLSFFIFIITTQLHICNKKNNLKLLRMIKLQYSHT